MSGSHHHHSHHHHHHHKHRHSHSGARPVMPEAQTAPPYGYPAPHPGSYLAPPSMAPPAGSPGGFLMPAPHIQASRSNPSLIDAIQGAVLSPVLHRRHHSQTHLPPPPPSVAPSYASQSHPHVQAARQIHHEISFGYSKCTGRKKALCIGINYRGAPHALHGCVNDAKNVRQFLIKHYGYRSEDIVLLSDDGRTARELPTRQNIFDAMRWLVQGAQPHDSLFFHYSGHGGQTKDRNGDELDGYDEVIYPIDFKTAGHIVDDDMHMIMVRPLPKHCRLTAIFDSCHSGTALDLPYIYDHRGRVKGLQVLHQSDRASPADVISWSGCKDSQTSADTVEKGKAVGAMSYAFIRALTQNSNQNYAQLLRSIRDILKRGYSQKPQLSSSHHIDTNLRFIC